MLNILCPASCVFCAELTKRNLELCVACEKELPWLQNCCRRCAEVLPASQTVCGACIGKSFPEVTTIALFHYISPISKLIAQLKFGNNLTSAMLLGTLLSNRLITYYQNYPKPEVIIPIPLYHHRLRERGYNQALELIRPSVKSLQISVDRFCLRRVKNTMPQAALKAKERIQNVNRAFIVDDKINYRHVALVDDVITTGSTVTAAYKALSRAGIKKIDVWCCARSSKV